MCMPEVLKVIEKISSSENDCTTDCQVWPLAISNPVAKFQGKKTFTPLFTRVNVLISFFSGNYDFKRKSARLIDLLNRTDETN